MEKNKKKKTQPLINSLHGVPVYSAAFPDSLLIVQCAYNHERMARLS